MTDKKKPAAKKKAPDKLAQLHARIDNLVHALNATLGINIEPK